MLTGRKLLATFCDVVPASYEMPDADFAPHVASGAIVRREEICRRSAAAFPARFVYYTLPHEAWRILDAAADDVAAEADLHDLEQRELDRLGHAGRRPAALCEVLFRNPGGSIDRRFDQASFAVD